MKKILLTTLMNYLPLAVLTVLLCGLIYAGLQQILRQDANDPQVQIASDTAQALAQGLPPDQLEAYSKVDLAKSLLPYVVVADQQGKVVAATAVLNGRAPVPPPGVLLAAKKSGENCVTWQPRPGIRQALVVRPFSASTTGYVIAGRSLLEVEKREDMMLLMISAGGIFILLAIFLLVLAENILGRYLQK